MFFSCQRTDAVLDMEQVFLHSVDYLTKNFKGCSYLAGFYEHDMASALWELSGEDGLLDAYKKELALHGKTAEEMKPIVRITTSDTGSGGANIYPMLVSGSENITINLGSPLRLGHRNGTRIAEFDAHLKLLYGKYQLAIGNLARLLGIEVVNPINCMKGVMDKLGIPRKYEAEAVDLFVAQYGEDPCTAHEIYFGISEILYMLACEGEEGSRITRMEETVARALSVNWTDVDFFIDFPDGSKGILECKTTNYNCQNKWANDSTPVNYEYQGRHYMAVMNINKMYFACLYGNNENEFFIRYMERDLDIEEDLIAEEEFFWTENVGKGVEPPYTEKPDLVLESIRKHCGPADKDADAVKLDRKYLASIEKYMALKEQKLD